MVAKKKTRKAKLKAEPFRVTRRQLADLLGVLPAGITRAVDRGMPCETVGAGRGHPSIFDLRACLAWQREQFAAAPDDGNGSPRDEYMRALTERVQQDLAVRSGELLPLDEVVLAGQNYTHAWKAKLRAIPRQMVNRGLVGRELERPIAEMLDDILREISRWETIPEARKGER